MHLPWHQDIVEELFRLKNNDALPHALMISGGRGLGADVLAGDMAAMLLCESPLQGYACGHCKSCHLLEAGSHNDFRRLCPEEEGKQIKVDSVRALVEFVTSSSMRDGYKVAVIDPVEALNMNGANALLKTLEEPAGNTVLFLVSDRPDGVLPTIRSRCQILTLSSPTTLDALKWLSEVEPSRDSEVLKQYLEISHGQPLLARRYLELDAWSEQIKMLSGLSLVLKRQQTVAKLATAWADDLLGLRLEWLVLWVEQMIRFASTDDGAVFIHEEGRAMLRYLAQKNALEDLFELRQMHLQQLSLCRGVTNPNPQLLCESLILSWNALMQRTHK